MYTFDILYLIGHIKLTGVLMKTFTKKVSTLSLIFLAGLGVTQAQISFTNSNSVLHSQTGTLGSNASVHSGNTVIVVDINGDGLDDIAKLDENRYLDIEYQQVGGTFTLANDVISISSGINIWGASMADVDHNGYKDFLYAGWGTGGVRIIKLNATGTGNLGIVSLPSGGIASQNCNFMDVNNDGWEDIFVCNDTGEPKIWLNDGTGNFPAEQGNAPHINFDVTPGTGTVIDIGGHTFDESGNYGSVWTDFDNDNDVDLFVIHCRQNTSTGDFRRVDKLFVNNGSNVFTENAAAHNLDNIGQDWTASFGDIDNDGDFDVLMTGHASTPTERLYLNDGSGNFSANIAQPTVSFNGSSWAQQGFMEDFDNDGWIDIIITGGAVQVVHRNNGNNTFTLVSNATLGFGGNNFVSFAAGDLNHDGDIDLYASYGAVYNTPSGSIDDVYWRNTSANSNHFITLNLTGTASTLGGLGARAFIYGSFGGSNVQTREVRASESYGTMNSFQLHFGLGSLTTVDSVRINWPSGATDLLINQTADQFINIVEGSTCNISGVTVSYTGSTTFCSPDSIQLNAPVVGGYSYLWSNGETTASIYADSSVNYSVVCSTSPTCSATSPSVAITVDPTETVSISAGGATTFCPGGSVTLTSTQVTGNTWSTTQTTQGINVTAAGTYSLAYQGLCQSWPSNNIVVTLLDATAPVTADDFVIYPAVGTVTATGTDLYWYDAASGGILLGTGINYSPGVITNTTTYYVEDVYSYGGSAGNHVGATTIATSSFSGTTINGYNKFTVLANSTLVSVQCSTDVAGVRIIELRNSVGTVLDADTVNIAVGTSTITLNFNLTPGVDYQLGTNTANNNAVLSTASPKLVRDNSAPVFPFTLAGVVSITTGNNGGSDVNAYYYFYDWIVDVSPTDVCTSVRTPATITVTPGSGLETIGDINLNVYPNPTTDFVNVEFTTPESGEVMLSVYDMLGKKVYDLNMGVIDGTIIRTISTVTYAKGVYNVKLTVNGKDYNTKVVVK